MLRTDGTTDPLARRTSIAPFHGSAALKRTIATLLIGTILLPAAGHAAALSLYQEAVLDDLPVGYWTFDDPTGTPGATNLGTQGAALDGTYVDVALEQFSTAPWLGTAAGFNGSSSLVDLANNISPWLNDTASLEFWIKTTQAGIGTWQAPAIAGADHNGDGVDLFWGTNSGGRFGVRRGDSGPAALTPNPINDDAWHHIVVTRDKPSGVMQAFLDGESTPVSIFDDVDNLDISTTYNQLGQTQTLPGPAQKLNAIVDEIAIYDYVLSGDRVHDHYIRGALLDEITQPGTIGDGSPSIIYEQESGRVLIDTDGNNIDAYILNSAAGIFTGDVPTFIAGNIFLQDNDRRIAELFFSPALNGVHDLGFVARPGLDERFLRQDLDLIGGLTGTPTFQFDLVVVAVPEASTFTILSSLASIGIAVACWRRRRWEQQHVS